MLFQPLLHRRRIRIDTLLDELPACIDRLVKALSFCLPFPGVCVEGRHLLAMALFRLKASLLEQPVEKAELESRRRSWSSYIEGRHLESRDLAAVRRFEMNRRHAFYLGIDLIALALNQAQRAVLMLLLGSFYEVLVDQRPAFVAKD